jgi:CheY-like chemotaxis protein
MTPEQHQDMTLEGSDAALSPARNEDDGRQVEPMRKQVLVVEDDPSTRELIVEMLSLWGYQSVPVGSAEEAEFAMRRRLLDAAVVDVFLPGRSGPSLIARIRAKFPDAMVIGISALGDAATARQCKGVGADLFISKPVTADQLEMALTSPRLNWQ